MKPLMSTTCPCTAARRARRGWAACPRGAWRSTSVKSPGKDGHVLWWKRYSDPLLQRNNRIIFHK